jgi:serine/threonine protein kinase
MKTYYEVLEVHPKARVEVIDAAYKALMKISHPDLGKSGKTATDVNAAHDILTSSKRSDYDRELTKATGKTIGSYKLLGQIAEGGFGRTYKAEHTVSKKLVCIKDCSNVTLDEAEILVEECQTLWDLRHYALPAMRDLVKMEDGRVLLVMSYVPGPTLMQLVEKKGALDAESVCWIAERIINAMNYCHRNGVVHGDIKPQNIIVQEDVHMAVLLDFGLSAVKPSSKHEPKGYTQYYAPPEEVGGKPLIPESDYYSLGMTLIYALSGKHEFVERRSVPDDVPDELCDFVKRLIRREVSARPNYLKDDLGDLIVEVRNKVFGRRRTGMKPITSK